MGRCARRTRKIVKSIASELTPAGVRFIADTVNVLEGTDWESQQKREMAVSIVKARFSALKIEAREVAIRAGVEAAVAALKDGAEAIADLGDPDHDEDPSQI